MAQSFIPYKPKPRKGTQFFRTVIEQLPGYLPALLVVAVIIAVYVGILFWNSILDGELRQLEARKTQLENSFNSDEVQRVQVFAQRAQTLNSLTQEQAHASRFFAPFQESIHPRVRITNLELNTDTGQLSLQGETPSFETLGEQFVIWQDRSDMFTEVSLANFEQSSAGVIEFHFELRVDSNIL